MNRIDPETARERQQQEPPYLPVWLGTFEAAHLLAYGTHWRLSDYVEELRACVRAGEVLPFVIDTPHYNDLIRRLLSEDDERQAVAHYMVSRGFSAKLQPAALILAEAARRAQVITRARSNADAERQVLPAHEWSEREYFRFERTGLYRRDQTTLVDLEWIDLQFFSADIEKLRSDGLLPPERPSQPLAVVLEHPAARPSATLQPAPKYKDFATKGANIKAALEAAGAGAEPSKNAIMRAIAYEYHRVFPWAAHPGGPDGLFASLKPMLSPLSRETLIGRARRAGWKG